MSLPVNFCLMAHVLAHWCNEFIHLEPNLLHVQYAKSCIAQDLSLCLSVGVNMFYICIIVYLYGDLAIYAAAVPISLMEVTW